MHKIKFQNIPEIPGIHILNILYLKVNECIKNLCDSQVDYSERLCT